MGNSFDSFNSTLKTAAGLADGTVEAPPNAPKGKAEKPKKERTPRPPRPEEFHWVVYGIGSGALLIAMAAAFLIVRVIDGLWSSWQLPAILAIVWFMTVSVFALVFALKTVKHEMTAQAKVQETPKPETKS